MPDNRKVIIFDLDDTLFDRTSQLDYTYQNINNITLFQNVKNSLEELKDKCVIYLTTCGDEIIQNLKIDILGIRECFRDIFVVKNIGDKLDNFQLIKDKHPDISANNIYVVGDRLDSEILFGNMLGLKTIRVKQGHRSSKQPESQDENPLIEFDTVDMAIKYLICLK